MVKGGRGNFSEGTPKNQTLGEISLKREVNSIDYLTNKLTQAIAEKNVCVHFSGNR